MQIFRIILPTSNLERDVRYYAEVFGEPGRRVSPNRHYFEAGTVILAIVDPHADGDVGDKVRPNVEHVYFAVADLEAVHARVKAAAGGSVDETIEKRPWGERSFYATDPFGNPLCFVDDQTLFTGR